jgi:hypothetical protein
MGACCLSLREQTLPPLVFVCAPRQCGTACTPPLPGPPVHLSLYFSPSRARADGDSEVRQFEACSFCLRRNVGFLALLAHLAESCCAGSSCRPVGSLGQDGCGGQVRSGRPIATSFSPTTQLAWGDAWSGAVGVRRVGLRSLAWMATRTGTVERAGWTSSRPRATAVRHVLQRRVRFPDGIPEAPLAQNPASDATTVVGRHWRLYRRPTHPVTLPPRAVVECLSHLAWPRPAAASRGPRVWLGLVQPPGVSPVHHDGGRCSGPPASAKQFLIGWQGTANFPSTVHGLACTRLR